MTVEVSLTEEQKREALINIREFVNATKDCVDVGLYLFARVHPAGAAILGIAYAVKNLIAAYGPDENDPVMKELKELRTKMDTMMDRMANHFTAFKSFYAENQFWNDVPLETSVLYQYMQDVISDPNEKNLKEFKRQYEKTKPVMQAQKLLYQLRREVMNPLKHAMAADPLMSTKTFDMWHKIIESVLMQLWEIEIKAGVLIHNEEVKDPEEMRRVKQLRAEIDKYKEELNKWDEDYEKNAPYWPDKVRQLMEKMQDENVPKTNEEVAQLIANDLEKIRTKSIFCVLVFNKDCHYVFHENRPNQTVISYNRGRCTAIVYRSLDAHKVPAKDLTWYWISQKIKRYEELSGASINHEDWVGQKHIDAWAKNPFGNSGLLIAVKTSKGGHDVSVKSTRTDLLPNGPGAYGYGEITHHPRRGNIRWYNHLFILSGFH